MIKPKQAISLKLNLFNYKGHINGVFWLTLNRVIVAVGSLLVAYVAANFLTPEVFGTYKYIIAFVSFVGIFSLSGTKSALIRTIASTNQNPIRFLFLKNIKFGYLGSIILFCTSIYYFIHNNEVFALALLVAAIFYPIQNASFLYRSYLNGTQKYFLLSLSNNIYTILVTSSVIAAMLLTKNIILIIFTFFLTSTIISLFFYLYSTHKFKYPKSTPVDQDTYTYAKRLSLMQIVKNIADQIDTLLIFQFLGPATVAAYALAKTPIEQLRNQVSIIRTLALPRFAKHSPNLVRQSIHKKGLVFLLFSFVTSVGYILIAPTLYNTFLPQYVDTVIYSQVLSLTLLAAPGFIYLEALTADKKMKELYVIETIIPLLKLFLIVLSTLYYGIYGLLAATVASHAIIALFSVVLYYIPISKSLVPNNVNF